MEGFTDYNRGEQAKPRAPEGKQISVREFYTVLFVHKWTIAISFVVMLALIAWALSLRQEMFVASVKFYINRGLQQQASLRYIGSRDWEEQINSLAEMGRSQGVLTEAAKEWDAVRGWADPPAWRVGQIASGLASIVEVSPVPETAIINILVQDEDADTALAIAGIYGRNFVSEFKRMTQQSQSRIFFQNAIGDVESKISAAKDAKANLQTETKVYNWQHEQMALTESIQILTRELTQKRVDRQMLERQVQFERDAIGETGDFVMTSALIENDLLKQIRFRITDLRLELSELESRYTPTHRLVKAKEHELSQASAQQGVLLQQAFREQEQRLVEMRSGESVLVETIADMKARLEIFPEHSVQIAYYDEYITSQWRLYGELIMKFNDMLVNDEQSLLENQIVQLGPPTIGGIQGQTQKVVYVFVAPIFALMLAISIAFMSEATNHTFQKAADLEEYTNLPVLASFRKL